MFQQELVDIEVAGPETGFEAGEVGAPPALGGGLDLSSPTASPAAMGGCGC
jgi:hypothetical protein